MFKRLILPIFILFFTFAFALPALAGFGISPPYVKTVKPIFPGSHFEQKITLLRSSAEEDLQAQVIINAPEIAPWVSVDKGEIFDLPKGQLRVPMIVKVDVPKDAEIGDYKGHINIKIIPKNKIKGSGVAIALGARVDIDLTVTNQEFLGFSVRNVTIQDFDEYGFPWNLKIFSYFFYKIKAKLKIENTGNVPIAPTRVHIDVYDIGEKVLLESADDTSIKKVDPFLTQEVEADFKTNLPPGQYWALIKVYKEKDIVYKDKFAFTIYKHGAPGRTVHITLYQWIELAVIILLILIFVLFLIKIKFWIYLYKVLYLVFWPFLFVYKKISATIKHLKVRFWKWVHKKSAQYQDDDLKK